MDNFNRSNTPVFLAQNYKRWGKQFDALKRRNDLANRRTTFNWYQHNGQPVNHLILPLLQNQTQFHCSFCDIKGVEKNDSEPTIEHFRPSSIFPLVSYTWANLFLCCYSCQKKGNRFDKRLLKPDRVDYLFDNYFIIDWPTGNIIEKYQAPDPRYYQANITIELYGLNAGARPKARLRELKHFQNDPNPIMEEYSYRFFLLRS